jgi:formylmethanofuran dehydrogenase subunit B
MPQSACFIDRRSVPLGEASRAAATLIAESRLPVFLVGACDVAGARAAIRLAERTGGVIDHIESAGALRELDVMRSFGKFIVTPHEARQRADTVLLVGSGLTRLWPDMVEVLGLMDVPRLALRPERRHILWIAADGTEEAVAKLALQTVSARDEALPGVIAALRACSARRRVGLPASEKSALDALAESLQRAHFGLVVYNASSLDALASEMLAGLVADLNKTTRFSTISVSGSGSAETLMQAAGWMTGFPARTGFARGYAEHDPWRFDARRLIDSGEADAIVAVSHGAATALSQIAQCPLIALSSESSARPGAKVHITIGQAGRDHDGVAFARETQSLAWRGARHPSDLPSAAAVLDEIAASLAREAA